MNRFKFTGLNLSTVACTPERYRYYIRCGPAIARRDISTSFAGT